MTVITLSVVRGEQRNANGEELGLALTLTQITPEMDTWLETHGAYDDTDTDVWVLVTPADEHPGELRDLIAQDDFTLGT